MFGFLNHALESFPIFNLFRLSIVLQISVINFILPCLDIFSDVDKFQIFILYSFGVIGERLYDVFKNFFTLNILHIKPFNNSNQFVNKVFFFFAVLDYHVFSSLNMLFKNYNVDGEWSVIKS